MAPLAETFTHFTILYSAGSGHGALLGFPTTSSYLHIDSARYLSIGPTFSTSSPIDLAELGP